MCAFHLGGKVLGVVTDRHRLEHERQAADNFAHAGDPSFLFTPESRVSPAPMKSLQLRPHSRLVWNFQTGLAVVKDFPAPNQLSRASHSE